jgi:predicted phage terminase large subunit-like protein
MIDDPVKSREEAESEAYREKCWDWFNDDLYTRLEPDAAMILTMTRWHDDDLAGRILKEMAEEGGEQWDVVSLPAIAEDNDPLKRKPGEALCPARYDIDALEARRKKLGPYSFAALFQQRPVPVEGALFKRSWFENKIVDKAPDGLRWARGYDLAVSQKTSADYTASFRCGYDDFGNLYIADGFRKRIEFPEQQRYVVKRMVTEKGTQHGIEKALHGQALVQSVRRVPAVRNVAFKAVKVENDKFTRALPWANLAEEGKVYLVRGGWNAEFLDEICRFTGKGDTHDDQVDAVSIAVGMLATRRSKMFAF